MIYELKPDEFHKVSHLFKKKEVSRAHWTLTTSASGRVFVDDRDTPQGAVVKWNAFYYVDGRYDNDVFIDEWYDKFFNEIIPEESAKGGGEAVFIYSDENKSQSMRKKMNFDAIWRRKYYELKKLKFNWKSVMPEALEMRKIDRDLLTSGKYTKIDEIENTVKNEYGNSIDYFLENSGGFCLLKDNEVLCSGTFYYNQDNNSYGMGIYTNEDHRQKGYATLVAAAVSEYCIEKGSTIDWSCFSSNVASCKLAEKLGHELYKEKLTYPVLF